MNQKVHTTQPAHRRPSLAPIIAAVVLLPAPLLAQQLVATGQNLLPGNVRENRYYSIDLQTGLATPLSPVLPVFPPAALGGQSLGRLTAYNNGQLFSVDRATWTLTPFGAAGGISATGFDIDESGVGYVIANTGPRSLFSIDTTTGVQSPLGAPNAVQSAIDTFFNLPPGTSNPFIIGLGSVGGFVYGTNTEAGALRTNLIAIDKSTGTATVIGAPNAAGSVLAGRYSGFSAMAGVDTDNDGDFDALFGNVNFLDASTRIGGIIRYNLADGTWTLVGTNPGIIFFGMAGIPACPADFNRDNTVDFFDYLDFVAAFDDETDAADFNRDNTVDFFDYLDFVAAFDAGCP